MLVQGAGFGVWGSGFRVQGSGNRFGVRGVGNMVQGLGFRVSGSGNMVQGLGFGFGGYALVAPVLEGAHLAPLRVPIPVVLQYGLGFRARVGGQNGIEREAWRESAASRRPAVWFRVQGKGGWSERQREGGKEGECLFPSRQEVLSYRENLAILMLKPDPA
jgi:hypothetical protein